MAMYEYTDKIIRYLTKQIIRTFGKAKVLLLSFDELNVLDYSAEMYKYLREITFTAYWKLAEYVYHKNLPKGAKGKITEAWLRDFLASYDPVTKYVYDHEVDRREARFAESVIASINRAKEIEAGMRSWSRMVNQYAIGVTDASALKAYADGGVERVIWITEDDEKRCSECKKREGNIYDIAKVPPKPHPGCRCKLYPYFGADD